MKEKTNIIIDYLERLKQKPLGCSDYSILIEMVNEEKKIIDFEVMKQYKNTLLGFLDYGLIELLKNENNKQDFYNSIIIVLTTWENLPNKWEISGQEFKNLFKEKEF